MCDICFSICCLIINLRPLWTPSTPILSRRLTRSRSARTWSDFSNNTSRQRVIRLAKSWLPAVVVYFEQGRILFLNKPWEGPLSSEWYSCTLHWSLLEINCSLFIQTVQSVSDSEDIWPSAFLEQIQKKIISFSTSRHRKILYLEMRLVRSVLDECVPATPSSIFSDVPNLDKSCAIEKRHR